MQTSSKVRMATRNTRITHARRWALVALMIASVGLTACGGGGDAAVGFDIGVVVAGQPVGGVQIEPGQTQSVAVHVGQSLELDASEPAAWTLYVGGTAVSGSGTTVYYGGASITQTAVSGSRIIIDTGADFALAGPVPITLVATSTLDATLVATINVLITN
jgi:hypothetical protein